MALAGKGPGDLLKFTEKYGVLGSIGKIGNPQSLQNLTTPYRKGSPPEELCLPLEIESFHDRLSGGWLRDTLFDPWWAESFLEQRQHFVSLCNGGIRESLVHPQLNWNIQRESYELFWSSLTLEGYLYLMAMWDLLGPGNINSCLHCHDPFLAPSNRTRFCSPSCYNKRKGPEVSEKEKGRITGSTKNEEDKA